MSNEIVHEMDMFTTIARIVGGKVPTDRAIDGVDQSRFLLGEQDKSNRDGFVVYPERSSRLASSVNSRTEAL